MDKYDIVFDLVEHPDRYSREQMTEILSDPETREIYNLLCKSASAFTAASAADDDIDAEWRKFAAANPAGRPRLMWFGRRAASVIGFALLSLVAVAVGIAVTMAVVESRPDSAAESVQTDDVPETVMEMAAPDEAGDSVAVLTSPIVFENETLENILALVASHYGLDVKFGNSAAAGLHLYFNFDPQLSVGQVIDRLNTFEQINIRLDGKTLTVD